MIIVESKLKIILDILIVITSLFIMILMFVISEIYTINFLQGDLSNLWVILAKNMVFQLVTGNLLLVGALMTFSLCIGGLRIYRGWKGEIKKMKFS